MNDDDFFHMVLVSFYYVLLCLYVPYIFRFTDTGRCSFICGGVEKCSSIWCQLFISLVN